MTASTGVGRRRIGPVGASSSATAAGDRSAAAPAQLVEAGVGGDAVGPGPEAGPPVEAADAAHDGDHRLLRGVGGVGVVAGDPPAHGVDPVVVEAQQLLEGPAVAALRGRHERAVVVVGALMRVEAGPAGRRQARLEADLADLAAEPVAAAGRVRTELVEQHRDVAGAATLADDRAGGAVGRRGHRGPAAGRAIGGIASAAVSTSTWYGALAICAVIVPLRASPRSATRPSPLLPPRNRSP